MDRIAAVPDPAAARDMAPEADINHRTGARMAYLVGQHRVMIRQVQFADTKAGALLAVLGLLAARGPISLHPLEALTPVVIAYALTLIAALLCSLSEVFPRYPRAERRRRIAQRERFSWLSLASGTLAPADFADWAGGAHMDALFQSVARSNAALAHVILAKFRMLRFAFAAAIAAIALTFLRIAGLA